MSGKRTKLIDQIINHSRATSLAIRHHSAFASLTNTESICSVTENAVITTSFAIRSLSGRLSRLAILISICWLLACSEDENSESQEDQRERQQSASDPIVKAGSGGGVDTSFQIGGVGDSMANIAGNSSGIVVAAGSVADAVESDASTEGNDADAETGAVTQNCPADLPDLGTTEGSINVGGTTRTYLLYVPESYTGQTPVPLVFDWHGLGMNGLMEQGVSSYLAKADAEGFIIVFPNGINNVWNIGVCCTESREVDDLGFARQMVEKMTNELCIDPKRIYSVGYSMGGGMSLYLACNAADIFAAVAPAAFDLLEEDEEPCHPSRPISVVHFRGTNDPIVLYYAHESTPPTTLLGYTMPNIHFMGADRTFRRFAELNGCTGDPVVDMAGADCQTYTQCNEAVEVTLCVKPGGGHDPGDANIGWPMLKKYSLP